MTTAKGLIGPFKDYAIETNCMVDTLDALTEMFNARPQLYNELIKRKLKYFKITWDEAQLGERLSNSGSLRDVTKNTIALNWWMENTNTWAIQIYLDHNGEYLEGWTEECFINVNEMEAFKNYIDIYVDKCGGIIINPEAIKVS